MGNSTDMEQCKYRPDEIRPLIWPNVLMAGSRSRSETLANRAHPIVAHLKVKCTTHSKWPNQEGMDV